MKLADGFGETTTTTHPDKTAAGVLVDVAGRGGKMIAIDTRFWDRSVYPDLVERGLLDVITEDRDQDGEYKPSALRLNPEGERFARETLIARFAALARRAVADDRPPADRWLSKQEKRWPSKQEISKRATVPWRAPDGGARVAYSFGETKQVVDLLHTIYRLCQREPLILLSRQLSFLDPYPCRDLTHKEIAAAAGREVDLFLRQDLAYLRAVRLIQGEFEGEDDRSAVPLTVRLTTYGMWEVEHPSLLTDAERSSLIEIVRALRPPEGHWRGTATYPHAEVEAMDEEQRARLEEIRERLGLLVSPSRVAAQQLQALRKLLDEVIVESKPWQSMACWLTRVTNTGGPRTSWIRSLEEASIDPRLLGSISAAEHADAPGSA